MLTSPPSPSSCSSSADSTALSLAAASPVWELWASSAITANRLPLVAASSRTAFSANGNVWIVQTTIFLSPESAVGQFAALAAALALDRRPRRRSSARNRRSLPATACRSRCGRRPPAPSRTASGASASCRSARKCADHAMEFVLPEPAEC